MLWNASYRQSYVFTVSHSKCVDDREASDRVFYSRWELRAMCDQGTIYAPDFSRFVINRPKGPWLRPEAIGWHCSFDNSRTNALWDIIWNAEGFGFYFHGRRYPSGNTFTLGFPAGLIVVLTTIMPLVAFRRIRKARALVSRPICVSCGYDLRATPDRCPECGTVPAKK